ncbi:hypothetical protein [Bacillus cereus]|uniref:hypothetical protein n=1 Tax=Bacillus cereus TaxID=1396 RepID=UPI0027D2F51C|nr:hypothetical protein [Bacillus cereus]
MIKMAGRILIIIAMVLVFRSTADPIEKFLLPTKIYCLGTFILLITFYLEILYDEKRKK